MTRQPRMIGEVVPGFYRFKRVKGGPWLPARVTVESGMIYLVEADETLQVGITADSYADLVVKLTMDGEAFTSPLLRCLWFGQPIDEAEYRHMLTLLTWARQHDPDHPLNHPDQPVRVRDIKVSSIF